MEKFSDVQKLKDLVDVASKVSNPRLSSVKIALNDIYEQELLDFGSRTGAGFMDKLKQILDRNKNPNPLETNDIPSGLDRDTIPSGGFAAPGMTEQQVSDRLYPKGQNPNVKKGPGQLRLFDENGNPTYPTQTPTQPTLPPTKEDANGQQSLDFDAPQQNTLFNGPTAPSGGPLSPPAAPGALPGVSEAPTQVMPSVAPEKVGPVGSPEEGNAGEPETAEAVAMDEKILTLSASLQDYVNYLQKNIKTFAESREMIDKINRVVTMFNDINGTKLPLVKRPAEQVTPQQEVPVTAPAAEPEAPNAEPAVTKTPRARTPKKITEPPVEPEAEPIAPIENAPTVETPTAEENPIAEKPRKRERIAVDSPESIANKLIQLGFMSEKEYEILKDNPNGLLRDMLGTITRLPDSRLKNELKEDMQKIFGKKASFGNESRPRIYSPEDYDLNDF